VPTAVLPAVKKARREAAAKKVITREAWESSKGLDARAAASVESVAGHYWASTDESERIQRRLGVLQMWLASGELSASDTDMANDSLLYWADQAELAGPPVAAFPPGVKAPTPTAPGLPGILSPFDAFMDAFREFVKLLADALQAIWKGFVAILSEVFGWIKKYVLDPLWSALESVFELVINALQSVMETVLKALTTMIHPGSELDPRMAVPMLATTGAAMMGAGLVIQTTNLLHPFKKLFGEQFEAMIYKFLGFSEISGAFWGSIGGELLDYPMRLWARMTFRARVPDGRNADRFLWHGLIDEGDWFKLHTYEGWPDKYIRAHYASQWRNPSVRDLTSITDLQGMNPEWISSGLKQLGYKPEDAALLAGVIARRAIATEVNSLRSELMKETAEGDMTMGELESALRSLGISPDELGLIRQIVAMRISRLQRLQEAKDRKAYQAEVVTASTEAFRRDLMDEGEYLEELLAAGVEPSKAAQRVYLEDVRKIPKPKRTLGAGAVAV